ncbi:MAG: hypothetical protein HY329_01370 [Chloroflexi bacterium]|nr:hypothetical protein [Chloroflexota bacterium]
MAAVTPGVRRATILLGCGFLALAVSFGVRTTFGFFLGPISRSTSGIIGQIFGIRYAGVLFGIVFFGHQLGSFLGVWLAGRLLDTFGSYDVIWWLSAALGVFAALVNLPAALAYRSWPPRDHSEWLGSRSRAEGAALLCGSRPRPAPGRERW